MNPRLKKGHICKDCVIIKKGNSLAVTCKKKAN